MLFYCAKLLELIGFAHVGCALFIGLTEERAMGPELKLLGLGALLFSIGRLLERKVAA
jgi:hypothetical protein